MMRSTAFVLGASILGACTGGGGGGGGGGEDPAWSGGPAGQVYVYSGPLYEVSAGDGSIIRELHPMSGVATNMQADATHAYMTMSDSSGNGHTYQLGAATDDITMLTTTSFNPIAVSGRELIGQINEAKVVRVDLDSGATTMFDFPGDLTSGALACQQGSLYQRTLYFACMRIGAAGTDAGMLTYDLDAAAFSPFVLVKAGVNSLALASNVDGTPSGALFSLYEGQATAGTRTMYKIAGGIVSPGVAIAGTANDLDEQAAIGNTVFVALNPDNAIVPFDAATMTAGAPIAISHPRHLRAGGGSLWSSANAHDGILVKIDGATYEQHQRMFDDPLSTEINAIAYGGE